MKIATWNVNSVRARLPRVLEWLDRAKPDVVALQEIKCLDDQFPREPFEDLGYRCETYGQKTYNGVAILSKRPIESVVRGMSDGVEDLEARVISAQVEDVILINAYVINGQAVGADRYHYKLGWLDRLAAFIGTFDLKEKIVVVGDFNVTFDDRDVYDPDLWREKILCSTPERQALSRVMSCGLADGFRKFNDEAGHYTWWDFRTMGFKRGQGLRIDHVLMSPAAFEACRSVHIDVETRGAERPSDHAPVIAEL